ncbi:DNA-binding response regulator [Dehalococcoides mccartyi CBDB1]|uniref:DNA-binding response regulator n=2 Tax=Dehalococcoides mccartyi TaxID=61435 RepID=A0A916KNK4_DEHMC|nr:DNA-binding response regulator [Dehalococcoides mccartyi CBDB1]
MSLINMKLLIIEDDPQIIDAISSVLKIVWSNIRVLSSTSGKGGIELVESQNPDAVLLDLGLPDIDGFDVLRQIRAFSLVPIIIITVCEDENILVKAFELDANDYLVKPFRQLELIARLKASMKKRRFMEEDLSVTYANIHFGRTVQEVYVNNKRLFLTQTEGRLLYQLVSKVGKVITVTELSEVLWGDYIPGASDNIKNYICRLRRKMEEDPANPKIILNHHGIGYSIPV